MLDQAIVFKVPAPIKCLEALELKDNDAQNKLCSKISLSFFTSFSRIDIPHIKVIC
tara:strand:- start:862 stop:1029 length:168 start_codon:yes stop_codon:yes gene_type:complete